MQSFDIAIPHFGVPEVTPLAINCLESVRAYSADYRLIFVDNGTPAEEWDKIDPYVRAHEHLSLIRNTKNTGFITAVNEALALSTAPYIVLMNNDTEAVAGWLEKLRMPLKGRVAMAGPRTTTTQSWQGRWQGRKGVHILGPNAMLAFFCVMISRRVFEEIGYLDSAYGMGFGDDDDYCRRAVQGGFQLALVQDLVIPHHHRSTWKSLFTESEISRMQNRAMRHLEKWEGSVKYEPLQPLGAWQRLEGKPSSWSPCCNVKVVGAIQDQHVLLGRCSRCKTDIYTFNVKSEELRGRLLA